MNAFTITEARHLDDEPLNEEEIEMLADGYPPSTLGGLDYEEVVRHLASRVLDLQEERDGPHFAMGDYGDDY